MEEIGMLFSNIEILAQYMQHLLKNLQEAHDAGTLDNSIGIYRSSGVVRSSNVVCCVVHIYRYIRDQNEALKKMFSYFSPDYVMNFLRTILHYLLSAHSTHSHAHTFSPSLLLSFSPSLSRLYVFL